MVQYFECNLNTKQMDTNGSPLVFLCTGLVLKWLVWSSTYDKAHWLTIFNLNFLILAFKCFGYSNGLYSDPLLSGLVFEKPGFWMPFKIWTKDLLGNLKSIQLTYRTCFKKHMLWFWTPTTIWIWRTCKLHTGRIVTG